MKNSFEHPPLGKSFITGFSANDPAYPILAVSKDARLNPNPPTVGTNTGLSTEHITAYPNNKFTRVERESEQRVLWLYEILPGPILTGKVMSDQANGEIVTTTKQELTTGAAVFTPSYLVLGASDVPTDTVKKVRELVTAPSFPTLNGTHVDEATGIKVDFTKQIVAASTTSSGAYDEIQPLDKWRSIQIVSALNADSLPADKTWAASIRQSFPDIMTEFAIVGFIAGSTIDIDMRYKLEGGYSGPCVARLKEKFLTAAGYAAYTAPAITKFQPESPQIMFYGASGGTAHVWNFKVPMSLHDTFSTAILGSGGSLVGDPATIDATSPIGYSSGTYIYVDVQPEKWRFGVWRVLEIEAKIP